ncbi:Altered xyloglucan 4-like [Parasponia andersonii]|uniref:Altered xyloglucan 4-like n=1 Tax=Parasponia andersonii TaxID=3476 RepID=A0A2P5BF89_PARAD|nr:Altered xyloglucan 4-like [Parasponia andersonii]
MGKMVPFLFISLATVLVFSLFLVCSPNPFKVTPKQGLNSVQNLHALQETLPKTHSVEENCDLFTGHWVPELRGSLYTNSSCTSIPDSKNCFKNGRKDKDFLNWRWKPEKCELPRFDAKAFLEMVRGKKMAFVGDSVARNHIESLLCLLSPEETPMGTYKDSEDRFRKWYFPRHDFTLMKLWTKFLIEGEERMINGTGELQYWSGNSGGYCNKTSPLSEAETNFGSFDWEMRNIQAEEIESARQNGMKDGRKFGVVDVTRAMLMRPDGHPGSHWDNNWMKGYNDCVHWCMPGPVDYWNDFLMAVMRKESGLVS